MTYLNKTIKVKLLKKEKTYKLVLKATNLPGIEYKKSMTRLGIYFLMYIYEIIFNILSRRKQTRLLVFFLSYSFKLCIS
jgi:hypothetical protein